MMGGKELITESAIIESLIPTGRQNAISPDELARATKMTVREVRQCVASLRAGGSLILSSTLPPGGYFYGETLPEIRDYVYSMRSRARNTARSYAAANKKLRELEAEGEKDAEGKKN